MEAYFSCYKVETSIIMLLNSLLPVGNSYHNNNIKAKKVGIKAICKFLPEKMGKLKIYIPLDYMDGEGYNV